MRRCDRLLKGKNRTRVAAESTLPMVGKIPPPSSRSIVTSTHAPLPQINQQHLCPCARAFFYSIHDRAGAETHQIRRGLLRLCPPPLLSFSAEHCTPFGGTSQFPARAKHQIRCTTNQHDGAQARNCPFLFIFAFALLVFPRTALIIIITNTHA